MTPIRVILRNRREALGLSQRAVAARAGFVQSMVSELESGNAANPTLATLRRWADALGFDIDVKLVDRGRPR